MNSSRGVMRPFNAAAFKLVGFRRTISGRVDGATRLAELNVSRIPDGPLSSLIRNCISTRVNASSKVVMWLLRSEPAGVSAASKGGIHSMISSVLSLDGDVVLVGTMVVCWGVGVVDGVGSSTLGLQAVIKRMSNKQRKTDWKISL